MRIISYTFFILFMVVNPLLISAQEETVPLLQRLSKVQGTGKVDVLNELSAIYRKTDRLKALDFAEDAYRLSVKYNYNPGKALALKNQGICRFFMGNNDSALICYNQSLAIYTSLNDEEGKSACYNNLGLVSQETGKYDEALKYYQLSIDLDRKRGDEIGMAQAYDNVIDVYIYKGFSDKALKVLNEVLFIYKKHNDSTGTLRSLVNRAAIKNNLGKYDEAFQDQVIALKFAENLKENYYRIMVYSNMGLVKWHMGNPDTALILLNIALGMSDEADNSYSILNSLWIESEIFSFQRKFDKSNEILFKILKRYEEMGNVRQVATVLTSLGRNLMQTNELDKAIGYFTKSLEITQSIDAKYEMLDNYRNLAYAQAITHNFAAADSTQDLFAHTYFILMQNDSVSEDNLLNTNTINNEEVLSNPTSNWIIAFLLLILIIILSVIGYSQKSR